MSPNTNSSEAKSSTLVNKRRSDNNSSDQNPQITNLSNKNDPNLKYITVTKHLCEPCPGTYIDILKTIKIICRDPSHYHDDQLIKKKSYQKVPNHSKPIKHYCGTTVSSLPMNCK